MGMAKMVLDSSNLVCRERWPSGLLWTCPPPTPLGSGLLASETSACAGTWGWPRWPQIAQTWCVGNGGHQDCYGHVPHQLLWVQGYWQVKDLPVQVHGDGQDGPK